MKIGTTLAIFKALGKIPVLKEQLTISDSGWAIILMEGDATKGSISSIPLLWDKRMVWFSLIISSEVVSSSPKELVIGGLK